MTEEIKMNVLRPFGPSIARMTMPTELVNNLNQYVDETILDVGKLEELDHGSKLAGNVKQEFKLEKDFIEKSGLLKFLAFGTSNWIKLSDQKEIKKFEIQESWIVRQFKNEYNPIHWHGGHISGAGFLKVPSSFGAHIQENKNDAHYKGGTLNLVHGTRQFLSSSIYSIKPEVGDFYFFPNYLMHAVYPFKGTDEERRSISFNAFIDEKIQNVYG